MWLQARGASPRTAQFFAEVAAARDRLEPYIPGFAEFDTTAGQKVLEIGVGLGSDHIRFARAGAILTGVDLTEASIALTPQRLALEGLNSHLEVADAEALPFPDGYFDMVYSWAVLHHTPNSDRAIREALRVLRPCGRACLMLYARHSWAAAGLWVRHALLRARLWRSVDDVLANHLESQGTRAFTHSELDAQLGALDGLRIDRAVSPTDRQVAWKLADITGRWLGFYFVVGGTARRT